ncbi:hypothetical protein BASA62_003186 [Batrachochytrium salamandrivorans]|nr:hypothetical protein BASA62_003186 [Batrachochytrium salamandrivorans]
MSVPCRLPNAEFMELAKEIGILKRVRHPIIIQFSRWLVSKLRVVFIYGAPDLGPSSRIHSQASDSQTLNLSAVARQIVKGYIRSHSHDPPSITERHLRALRSATTVFSMALSPFTPGRITLQIFSSPECRSDNVLMASECQEIKEDKGYNEEVDIDAVGGSLEMGIKPECWLKLPTAMSRT